MKRLALVITVLIVALMLLAFPTPVTTGGYAYGNDIFQEYKILSLKYDISVGELNTLKSQLMCQDWESEEELTAFLDSVCMFGGGSCMTKALSLQEMAQKNGKRLNMQVISKSEYLDWYGQKIEGAHAVCSAVVKNEKKIYFIEPATRGIMQTFTYE